MPRAINNTFFFFLLCYPTATLTAQLADSIIVNRLLIEIASEQVKVNGEFYAGTFPSFRESGGMPHNYQPDNNIFFTAISIFTLQNMLPYLTNRNKAIALQVIENSKKSFDYYKNKQGYPYYGFWPSGGSFMPHTYFFKYLKHIFYQGEDADDSVMILMATNSNDSVCSVLKKRMIEVSNLSNKRIKSTFRKYRDIPAYSTYLGKRMPTDFDIGVECNILYFMFDRKLPLVKQDTGTIDLLKQIIASREYMKSPTYLSPYYVRPPVLLYHISRLIGKFQINELEPYRQQLIEDTKYCLRKSKNNMDDVILNTTLIRLGGTRSGLESASQIKKFKHKSFIFFQARAAFWYPTPLKNIFIHSRYLRYYFYCPSYNKVLMLEHLVESDKSLKQTLDFH